VTVPDAETHRESFQLERWIKLADLGWFSGDHHVHAAGCAHYEAPTQGVTPEAMMRHILGEDPGGHAGTFKSSFSRETSAAYRGPST
jgi:hypothetical protein